jgi:hypothetical protein
MLLWRAELKPAHLQKIARWQASGQYRLIATAHDVMLLQRKNPVTPPLRGPLPAS